MGPYGAAVTLQTVLPTSSATRSAPPIQGNADGASLCIPVVFREPGENHHGVTGRHAPKIFS